MFGEEQPSTEVSAAGIWLQRIREQLLLKELFADPQRHSHLERTEAARRKRQVRFEQSLELQKRLVIEDDVIDILQRHPAFREAILHRVMGEAGVVFFPAEALFLRGCDDLAVPYQGGGAVMVERGNPENVHQRF